MTHDSLSNMLTKIRNAILVKHKQVTLEYTKTNLMILTLFLKYKYINDIQVNYVIPTSFTKKIKITLKYDGWWNKKSYITTLIRISKLSQRKFTTCNKINFILKRFNLKKGLAILSTSCGILSHFDAIQLHKGGEILCYID